MKHLSGKALAFLLILLAALTLCFSACADEEGYCGGEGDFTNLHWKLTDAGDLTITGTGKMRDFPGSVPWGYNGHPDIKSVVIANGVTSIGKKAFRSLDIPSIVIPGSVTSIGDSAFEDCANLGSVSIPGSVTSIGEDAFSGCSSLENVEISNGVVSIGINAFYGCVKLTSITIPASVTNIGKWAFSRCSKLQNINVNSSNSKYASMNGVLFNHSKTTLIAFPGERTTYTIPNGVTAIGYGAFGHCINLTSVTIPDSVTRIGENAFWMCDHLKSVTIPGSVTVIEDFAFESCSALENVTIQDGVTEIGDMAFENCSKLQSVRLPESIDHLGSYIFDTNKTTLIVPKGSEIENWAKKYRYTYSTYNPADHTVNVTTDGNGTASASPASGPKGTEIVLTAKPNTGYKFKKWEVVNGGVTITDNKFTIKTANVKIKAVFEKEAEAGTSMKDGGATLSLNAGSKTATVTGTDGSGATKVTIPATVTVNGTTYKVTAIANNAFKGQKKITKVTIGKNVTTIGKYAFSGCTGLKTISGMSGLIEIGDGAFQKCTALKSITIGKKVKKIGKNAFNGCKKLAKITIKTTKLTKKTIGKNCFKGVAAKAEFKCPKKQKKDYETWLKKPGNAPKAAVFK